MTVTINFNPNGTLPITASTVSLTGKFTTQQSIQADSVLCYNAGANPAFVGFGNSKSSATITANVPTTGEVQNGTPIAAGAIMVLTKGPGNDTVCTVTSTQTSLLYFTAGQGN